MQGYNVIAVVDEGGRCVLMCRRRREPYRGLANLVGGKIEEDESGEDAAYRELYEETGIARGQIALVHVMDLVYHLQDFRMEVYAGRLRAPVRPRGEENELFWASLDENFFDYTRFAGEGNLGHILRQALRAPGME